jgi:hypothetical protein
MKLALLTRVAQFGLVALPLVLLGGCPTDEATTALSDPTATPTVSDPTLTATATTTADPTALATALPGQPPTLNTYWVEFQDGHLLAYDLPSHPVDPLFSYTMSDTPPDWYIGPGLYHLDPDALWTLVWSDPGLTLDSVLTLYDERPAVP